MSWYFRSRWFLWGQNCQITKVFTKTGKLSVLLNYMSIDNPRKDNVKISVMTDEAAYLQCINKLLRKYLKRHRCLSIYKMIKTELSHNILPTNLFITNIKEHFLKKYFIRQQWLRWSLSMRFFHERHSLETSRIPFYELRSCQEH